MAGGMVGPCLSRPATRPCVAGSWARPGPRGAIFFPGLNLPLPSPFLFLVSTPSPNTHTSKRLNSFNPLPPPYPKPFQEPSPLPPTSPCPSLLGGGGGGSQKEGAGRSKVKKPVPNNNKAPQHPTLCSIKLEIHSKPASVWNNKTGCGRVVLTGHLAKPGQRESMHS